MSERYPGGIITKSPATPTGPYENGTAPGIWTLEQQMQYQQQGIWPTAGLTPNYIEDVFSTYLYTGNDTTQTIANGINLSTNGGMVWIKPRNQVQDHVIFDTVGGITKSLASNNTSAQYTATGGTEGLVSFNTTGFTTKLYQNSTGINNSACNLVSWTFRKQPKFFDVVTYSGNSTAGNTVAHNLGSVPGTIIVKITSGTGSWFVYHRSLGATKYILLDDTGAAGTSGGIWNNTEPTSSVFTLGNDGSVNSSGQTYVAYLFAHDAGGFGLTGTDNVISCGSFTLTGGEDIIDLGYEPQWLLTKRTNSALNWQLTDNMRGMTVSNSAAYLYPNLSNAETSGGFGLKPTATGISITAGSTGSPGDTFIYIAIRRGPMKVPTSGTSVLATVTRSGTSATAIITGASSPPDLVVVKSRSNATEFAFTDRLRGVTKELSSSYSFSEADFGTNPTVSINMNGWTAPAGYATFNQSGYTYVDYLFSRWPNVFDEVCYTGTGSATTQAHNLGVVPELIIIKTRSNAVGWAVSVGAVGYTNGARLETVDAFGSEPNRITGTPTTTTFPIGTDAYVNVSARTYVAYLFATCPGVSKVGTYTGTGTLTTINCGFTGGARFVLIKKSSGVGSWFIWDTARGMVSGTDPSLRLNVTDAEQSGDSIYSIATGFQLLASPFENVNTNGDTYIFLAIA